MRLWRSVTVAIIMDNHPWLVTEPEADGVPGWQTGATALCLYSQSPQACKPVCRAPTWLWWLSGLHSGLLIERLGVLAPVLA